MQGSPTCIYNIISILCYLILSIISIILPRLNITPLFCASCHYILQPVPYRRITRTVLGSLPFICSPKPTRDLSRFSAGARCSVANSCRACMYISPAWNIAHQSKTGPHNNHTLRTPHHNGLDI